LTQLENKEKEMKEKVGNTLGVTGVVIILASLFASCFLGELIPLFCGGVIATGLGLGIIVS